MSDPHLNWTTHDSPLGRLTLVAGRAGITQLWFPGRSPGLSSGFRTEMPSAMEQLAEYFAGCRRTFDLALDPSGSEFQRAVWQQLLQIPYGSTLTYGEVAARIDESLYKPGIEVYMRPRVVGGAIGANPIPIVIPCHRVIGANGSLTGYRGGLPIKRALLTLERPEVITDRRAGDDEFGQLALL